MALPMVLWLVQLYACAQKLTILIEFMQIHANPARYEPHIDTGTAAKLASDGIHSASAKAARVRSCPLESPYHSTTSSTISAAASERASGFVTPPLFVLEPDLGVQIIHNSASPPKQLPVTSRRSAQWPETRSQHSLPIQRSWSRHQGEEQTPSFELAVQKFAPPLTRCAVRSFRLNRCHAVRDLLSAGALFSLLADCMIASYNCKLSGVQLADLEGPLRTRPSDQIQRCADSALLFLSSGGEFTCG